MISRFLAILALLIAAACGGSSGGANGAGSGPTTPPVTPSRGTALDAVVLKATDIGQNAVEEPVQNGNVVKGQVTLDLCSASFGSERLRTARLQVAFNEAVRHLGVSNEVVTYRPGGTRRAYAELRAVAAHCPQSFRVPGAIASHVRVEPRDSRLLSKQLTVSALFAPTKVDHVWSVAIYQFEGNLFSGVYVFAGTRTAAVRFARQLAAVSADRLRAAVVSS
jgi:hypothetical protein